MREAITLWMQWFNAFAELRGACSRTSTFLWLLTNAVGMTVRADLAGVTSVVRSCWLKDRCYKSLLATFNESGVKLDKLTECWMRLCLKLFGSFLYRVQGRLVLVADGIKAPKEGRKMPAVKLVHQEAGCNAKAEFVMAHSCQAIALLVRGISGLFAVPLISRIHEGVVFSNRDRRTLLDKLVAMLLGLEITQGFYLIADAYYGNSKIALPLLAEGHHLVARVRVNAVGYMPAAPRVPRSRGRPKFYGRKLRIRNQFKEPLMQSAPSPVYGEEGVTIRYRSLQLLWRPMGKIVQFILVVHPTRGSIILFTTDLALNPLKVIELYGARFKIEVSFRQAVQTIGTYGYHFWMMDMNPIRRGSGNQYLHKATALYRQHVRRKIDAYHRYMQLGIIVQGLLQYLAVAFPRLVWSSFGSWLRTMKPNLAPSELVVATALRNTLPQFLHGSPDESAFKKFLAERIDPARCPGLLLGEQRLAA